MEEDMERLRSRRRAAGHPRRHHHHGGSMPSPNGSTFSMDSTGSVILGLGTGAGIRDVLPLKSAFFDWCCEYFKEPQMRVSIFGGFQLSVLTKCYSKLNRTSLGVFSTTIRFGGNSEMNRSTSKPNRKPLSQVRTTFIESNVKIDVGGTEDRRWDRPVATFQTTGFPLTMAFHSYDQHLVVANEPDMIRSGIMVVLGHMFLNGF